MTDETQSEQSTPTKRPSFQNCHEMVTVKVGEETKENKEATFTIHKDFICYYSPYFAAAFQGSFHEGETKEVQLKEATIASFCLFVQWLYSQRIDNWKGIKHLGVFIDAWVLGSMILAPKFQNEVIHAFDKQRLHLNQYPSLSAYNRAYENTLPESPLRRYLIAIIGSSSRNPKPPFLDDVCRDVLVDMTIYMRLRVKKDWVKFSEDDLKQFYVEEKKQESKSIARQVGSPGMQTPE